jgi:hypothetical protein
MLGRFCRFLIGLTRSRERAAQIAQTQGIDIVHPFPQLIDHVKILFAYSFIPSR